MKLRRSRRGNFWARPAMAPTAQGREAGAHAARARRWRRLVAANFVAFPFAVLALLMVTAQLITGSSGNQGQTSGDSVPTVVRAEAIRAVDQWLGSDEPPLADARVAGWDGAEKMEWPDSIPEKDRTYDVWVARVLVSTDASVYVAGVQVTVDAEGAAAGVPSLEVLPSAQEQSADSTRWPGTSAVSVSGAVDRAVSAWAQAYTSGDPVALTTLVSDPDTQHSYLPISGFTSVTATVNSAAWHAYPKGGDPDTSQLMVNVTLAVERDGLSTPAQMTFDLLVTAPTTGSARVTAWGAPGSAPTLTPYSNAVTSTSEGRSSGAPTPTPEAGRTESGTTEPGTASEPDSETDDGTSNDTAVDTGQE